MSVFGLVHGAWLGGWCWERLVPELEARGHTCVAPDLPCDDVDAAASDYARVVDEALGDTDGDLVLVGHTLGGITIPLVAARRPVRALVYVCGLLARPGRPLADVFSDEPTIFAPGFGSAMVRDERERSYWANPEDVIEQLFGDAPRDVAMRAVERLRRQARTPSREPCALERMPDVATTYLLATDDRVVSPAWSRIVARDWLGVEPIELPGGNSPFLSRPAELAALLDAV